MSSNGNIFRISPVNGEFPSQRPVTRSFDILFDLRLNKLLSKQSWGWWFETPSRSLWRQCNGVHIDMPQCTRPGTEVGWCMLNRLPGSAQVHYGISLWHSCKITALSRTWTGPTHSDIIHANNNKNELIDINNMSFRCACNILGKSDINIWKVLR